jgi:hypothetical protein
MDYVKAFDLSQLDSYDTLFNAYDEALKRADAEEKAKIRDIIVTKAKSAQSDGDAGEFRFAVDAENKTIFMVTANNRYPVKLAESPTDGKYLPTFECERAIPPRMKNELKDALKLAKYQISKFWQIADISVTGEPV